MPDRPDDGTAILTPRANGSFIISGHVTLAFRWYCQ